MTESVQIYINTFHIFCQEIEAKDPETWALLLQQQKLIKYLRGLSKLIKDTPKAEREQEYRKKLMEKDW